MRVLAISPTPESRWNAVQPWRRASSCSHSNRAVGGATAAVALGGDEVVDVEVVAPGEHLVDAEARHRGGLLGAVLERAGEPVTGRHAGARRSPDERLRAGVVPPQLEQGASGEVGLAGAELADDHGRDVSAGRSGR